MTCQGVFIGTNSSRTEVYRVIIMFKCEDRFEYLSWVSFRSSWEIVQHSDAAGYCGIIVMIHSSKGESKD